MPCIFKNQLQTRQPVVQSFSPGKAGMLQGSKWLLGYEVSRVPEAKHGEGKV